MRRLLRCRQRYKQGLPCLGEFLSQESFQLLIVSPVPDLEHQLIGAADSAQHWHWQRCADIVTAEQLVQTGFDAVLIDVDAIGPLAAVGVRALLATGTSVALVVCGGLAAQASMQDCLAAGAHDSWHHDHDAPEVLLRILRSGITLRRTQQRLRWRETNLDLLDQTLRLAPTPTVITDQQGRIGWLNPAFAALVGLDEERCRECDSLELLEALEDDISTVDRIRLARRQGASYVCERRCRGRGGREFLLSYQLRPLHRRGQLLAFVETVQETPDQRADQEHEHQQQRCSRLQATHGREVVWSVSWAGVFTSFSPAIERLTGFRPDFALLLDLSELFDAESSERLRSVLVPTTWQTQKQRTVELRFRAADGSLVWTETELVPELAASGQAQGLVGLSTSIQRRKDIRQQLDEVEQSYRLLFEQVQDAVLVFPIGDDGQAQTIGAVNRAACRLLGRDQDRLRSLNPMSLMDNHTASRAFPNLLATLRRRGRVLAELVLLDAKGLRRTVEMHAVLLRLAGRQQVLAVLRDIGRRKRAETTMRQVHNALREEVAQQANQVEASRQDNRALRGRLLALLDLLPGPAWIQDVDGRISHANAGMARWSGCNQADIIGSSLNDVWSAETARRLIAQAREASATDQPRQLQLPLGDAVFRVELGRVRCAAGQLLGVAVVALPVVASEPPRATPALPGLGKLSQLGHLIRAPMNGILGMGDLLLDHIAEGEALELVQTMQRSAEQLLDVLSSLIDLARLQAGELSLLAVPFRLSDLVHAAVRQTGAADLVGRLLVHIDPRLEDAIISDPDRCHRLLTALIARAGGTGEGGLLVHVTGQALEAQRIELQVRLEGPGGAGAASEHADLTVQVTRGVLQLLGGRLEQVDGDHGRLIQACWPVAVTPAAGPVSQLTPPLTGRRILIVDPWPRARDALAEAMHHRGARVGIAADGQEAEAYLRRQQSALQEVDLVLIQCLDQGVDVMASLERLRAIGGETPPLVLLGPERTPIEVLSYRAQGAQAYLVTPLPDRLLVATLLRLLRTGRRGLSSFVVRVDERHRPPLRLRHPIDELRVLVVDDGAIDRRVARLLLEQQGVQVLDCSSGEDGLVLWQEQRPDLILLDCLLEGMNGYAVAQQLRERERRSGGHTPVIGVTSSDLPEQRSRCRAAGMDDVLLKPLRERDLLTVLERWR
jgi:PAS domain S-box-containing protein